jgi:DNA-binding transcriptional LysR family regulator
MAQLAYLAAIDRHPTWAAAATSLGVTPSALSQGVAELERRLGLALYAADGRRRVPLDYTATVVDTATRVLAEVNDLVRWLRAVAGGSVGALRVGMIDIVAVHHCRESIGRFRRSNPEVEVSFAVAPTGVLLGQLERGELDVVVCVDPHGVGSFRADPLLRDDLAVYAPPGLGDVTPSAWGPWLLFPPDSRTRRQIDQRLRQLGVSDKVALESHQPEVLCEMVRAGLGWTVLPTAQAEQGPAPLLRVTPEPLLTRTISVVTRRDRAGHPLEGAFANALRAGRDLDALTV